MSLRAELRDFLAGFFDSPGNYQGGLGLLGPTQSGIDVNETSSMTVGAVAACQRIISSAVASMACHIYERMPNGGHRLAVDHPLFPVLSLRTTNEYPAVDFFGTGQVNLLQNGNCYAEILTTNGGQVELQLRSPFMTHVYRDMTTGEISYKTTDTPTGKERKVALEDMVHVKNMGVSPYIGLSPIRLYMRDVVGVAMAAQQYGARLFKNDARPGGYLQSDVAVKPSDKLAQIQSWMAGHQQGNQHRPAYLDGGVKWAQVGISPDEAQFLQTRQFQRSEIASIYGVPAHMLGDPTETKATIEQKALEFLLWTVKIWLRRWEHALNVKLLSPLGRNANKFFIKFDTSEYERADFETMMKGLQTGRYGGFVALDEGRKMMGLNPTTPENFDGTNPGMTLFRPVNMAIMSDDPEVNSVKNSPASGGNDPNSPAEEQPAPSTDGGDDSRALARILGSLDAKLDHIEGLTKPNLATWERIIMPVFHSAAGSKTEIVTTYARGVIRSMEMCGVTACREQSQQIVSDFQAMARALTAHTEEVCE